MSEAPPDKPTDAASETKSETAKEEAPKEAAATASAPAGDALADAAKAMDAAEKKAETAPAAPAVEVTAQPASAPQTALAPSAAANTSGMHLQYVAPGVHRQSWLESNKTQLLVVGVMCLFGFLILRSGFGGTDLSSTGSSTPNGVGGLAGPTPTPTQTQQGPTPPIDDTSYQPLANRMPASDLTVNAGALNTMPPVALPRGDAGANKGGYADERADLDAAEAMVAKDPDKALALVDKHDKDYPRGILSPDARIIRIEAFQKKGDDPHALALADDFLQDYPHSPRAGTVQAIEEQIKNKNGGGNGAP